MMSKKKEQNVKNSNVTIIDNRGKLPNNIQDIWFKISYQDMHFKSATPHVYIKHVLIKNSDIKFLGTEKNGDKYHQGISFIIKDIHGRTIDLPTEIGEKFLKLFEMINFCVAV